MHSEKVDVSKNISTQNIRLRKAIWWVIQELQQESDSLLSDSIQFTLHSNTQDFTDIEQRRALQFLTTLEVISIISTKTSSSPLIESINKMQKSLGNNIESFIYQIEINKEKFAEVCDSYEHFFNKKRSSSISFDKASGTLRYANFSFMFDPSSNSFAILDVIINTTDEFYKIGDTLSFDEVNAIAMQYGEIEEMDEKAIYNSLVHINTKIEKRTSGQVTKFIINRKHQIGVNYKYAEDKKSNN